MVRALTSGRFFALVSLSFAAAVACGFAEPTGGSVNDAGTGGATVGGMGGAGDAGAGSEGGADGEGADVGAGGEGGAIAVEDGACLPRGLADLVGPCSLVGDCVYAVTEAGYLDTCYAAGERTRYLPKLAASTTIVKSADGALCYELESVTWSEAGSTRTLYRWLDSGGGAIALGRLDPLEAGVLYVVTEGSRYRVELGSETCVGVSPMPRDTARCEMGACSF